MSRTPSLYLPRPSGVHQLHPLTKLAFALTALVTAIALPDLPSLLAVYAFTLLPLSIWGRVIGPFTRSSLRAVAPFLLSLIVIQGFFTPGSYVLLQLGPFAFTAEGLASALTFAARIWIGLSSALLLMLTTRLDALMLALTQRGLSPQISYIVVTALQLIPHFQVRAQTILDAQRSRGLDTEGGLRRRFRALQSLVLPLLLSSLLDTDKRALALEARGFRRPGPRTSWMSLRDSVLQRGLRWLCAAAALALLAGRLARALAER
ncbi:MAG: energy-coupling factor transporter transmembrane component T [Anaerolineales bacterium]